MNDADIIFKCTRCRFAGHTAHSEFGWTCPECHMRYDYLTPRVAEWREVAPMEYPHE